MTNFIGGAELPPSAATSNEIDVVFAIQAAQRAQAEWARVPVGERAALVGKLLSQLPVSNEEAGREVQRAAAADGETLGVIGLILPGARPLEVLLPWLGALLTAGNTVVIKPASRGGAEVREVIPYLGDLPAGVCNIVFGAGEVVGRFLVEHPGVPGIAFAGRTATGRRVIAQAAPQLKRLKLELGAKNAAVVLRDADLDRAAEVLAGAAFLNDGDHPFALAKILVQAEVFDAFVTRFASLAPEWAKAPPAFDEWVKLARDENGRVSGGERRGECVRPVVVAELTNCSEIHQTELLGPLVTVNSIKYPPEGVKWANTSPFGRAGAVWTANLELGRKLARQLDVGTAWVNAWYDPARPGEIGASRRGSAFGFTDVLELGRRRTVVVG